MSRTFAALLLIYLALALPSLWSHEWLMSPAGYFATAPYSLLYRIGHHWPVVENPWFGGWEFVSPTPLGWVVLVAMVCGPLWCLAWALHRLSR